MKTFRRFRLAALLASTLLTLSIHAADTTTAESAPRFAVGQTFETLDVNGKTYRDVRIRSISAQTAIIQHADGLTSLRLAQLPAEIQARFGYDPSAADAEAQRQQTAAEAARRQREVERARIATARAASASQNVSDTPLDRLLKNFGQPPMLEAKVDLRKRFNELGLWIKNQGARPSCAVFAVVSALEFQTAEVNGRAERFSEEYLLWATRRSLRRPAPMTEVSQMEIEGQEPGDEGFSLTEVVTALRAYGIVPRERVPNRFSGGVIEDPPEELIAEARSIHRVSVHPLPGRDRATLIANVVHALNAGLPVPAGVRWPIEYNWRTGYLDRQRVYPNRGHAITLVGYSSPTGRIEDAVFTFKNSWGVRWGIDGYGTATYEFLRNNLLSAIVLEVHPQ